MNVVNKLVAAIVRAALQALSGFLVAKGLLDAGEASSWVADGTVVVTAAVLFFVTTVGWSLWEKVASRVRERFLVDIWRANVAARIGKESDEDFSAIVDENLAGMSKREKLKYALERLDK